MAEAVEDEHGNVVESLLPTNERPRARPLTRRALVTAAFKKRPLSEVVEAIVDATGANVLVGPLGADAADPVVTARFANAPVDVAVRTLAGLADLGVIEDGNVLIVTTRERADARSSADAAKRQRKADHAAGAVGLGGAAAPGPDVAAEVAKLREQVEQLRKQLDEAQKGTKK